MSANLNKKPLLLILAVGCAILIIAASLFYLEKRRGGQRQLQPNDFALMPQPSPGIVIIKNYAFVPSRIRVKKGEEITWINEDAVSHTVSAEFLGGQRIIPSGASFKFNTADIRFSSGELAYQCDFHPDMRGTIALISEKQTAGFGPQFDAYSDETKSCMSKALGNRLHGFLDGTIQILSQDESVALQKCLNPSTAQ